jgi:hypothetical protein
LIWGALHEPTGANCALIEKMAANRAEILTEVRRRWENRDPTPLLPTLAKAADILRSRHGNKS